MIRKKLDYIRDMVTGRNFASASECCFFFFYVRPFSTTENYTINVKFGHELTFFVKIWIVNNITRQKDCINLFNV